MKLLSLIASATLLIILCNSCGDNENTQWCQFFNKYNAHGTMVLKNMVNNKVQIYNKERSDSAYIPASTFKILNSMIALHTSAINSVDDTIKWDGTEGAWDAWNTDQTMRTAIQVSCVWFYQELARRIGTDDMQYWVNKSDYGNKNVNKQIDMFWLEGDLRITAMEQIAFIEKLIKNELPFDKSIQETVKQIMITDQNAHYTIRSKTGWSGEIGWYVGYIEANNNTWIFAMNQNMDDLKDAKYRKLIVYDVLKYEQIID